MCESPLCQKNQESEQVCESPLSPGLSSSMPTVSNTGARLSEIEDIDKTCGVLGTKVNDYDIVSADNDSESEPERDTYPIQYKRKADYLPPHLKERYVPFRWDYDDDDESPYAPDPRWSASNRNKSTISSQKVSRVSAAQNKSQKRRDNATDTSSEDSHTSVNIKLKDSYF